MSQISYPITKHPILNVMMRAVSIAGRSLIRDFGEIENLQVSKKGPGNFVTSADTKAEQILREHLTKARPEYGFLMEESGIVSGKDKDYTWIIDPLDGTNNFLHGLPHFAITVSLKRKEEIIEAVTYDPLKDEMFYAKKGFGAFMNQRRLRVSNRQSLLETILATSRLYTKKSNDHFKIFQKMSSIIPSIRQTGSASLDLAYLAAGRLDGVWACNLEKWDTSAGILLIKEAGGNATNAQGNNLSDESTDIIAANIHIHKLMIKIINSSC
jgi:myo-inositol-1(or 4)-monophosphatase